MYGEHMSTTPTSSLLDALDVALVRVRRTLQAPAYRRRLIQGVGAGMPLSTLRVARAIERCGEQPPSIGDIAELLGVDPSTASRAAEDAVSRGMVAREACDWDRRRQRLRLTEEGVRILEQVNDVRRALLGEVTQGWDADELAELVHRLDHLLSDFDRTLNAP